MYNRYVPNQDGSYVRQSVPDTPVWEEEPRQTPPPCWEEPEPQPEKQSVFSRLKHLLPKDLDTGDLLVLIVVLLLLLEKDENNEDLLPVLITAAAFLFLK